MKRRIVAILCLLTSAISSAPAAEIGSVEDFALEADRTTALKQLIPGTEEYLLLAA